MPRNSDLLDRETHSLEIDGDQLDRRSRRRQAKSAKNEWFDKQSDRPPKDIWDKTAAIAPIVSGTLIFAMGGICTYNYNQQQLRLQEIQTIEKFIPHLMGNEQSKRAAILAISSLTNAELAGKFAQIFASQGTVSALQSIAENGSEKEKNIAADALARALEKSRPREIGSFEQLAAPTQLPLGPAEGEDNSEAVKLESLAQICRDRGHLAASETLLKQAVSLRLKASGGDSKEALATLKKLADVQLALGSKDAEQTQRKILSLTEGDKAPPPVKPPLEENQNQQQQVQIKSETRIEQKAEAAQPAELKPEITEEAPGTQVH
jgi:hypothetical protein